MKGKKIELLAPAGNFEKLETAIHFGADAVYMGGKNFSLRNYADNFSEEDLKEGISYARSMNVKTYIACNIYPYPDEIENIREYLCLLNDLKPDALIIADPGIIRLARKYAPDLDIHLSTQSSTTNHESVKFWKEAGVSRVNTARELSLEQIKYIKGNSDIELELFVHGAMCISYSGRCLLSSFMSKRSANHGECSHPCRWKYRLEEEMRPGEYYPVAEDSRGAYFFNSRDLCMIEHIDKLIFAGADSLKIEGRMKGIFYLGAVVKVYREAVDAFLETGRHVMNPYWTELLSSVSNRQYCTGFYLGDEEALKANTFNKKPDNIHNFLGKISGFSDKKIMVEVRNKFKKNEDIKILSVLKNPVIYKISGIYNENMMPEEEAKPNEKVFIEIGDLNFKKGDILFKN
ncbi:MAG: peptidase U32 [Deltaproteobacteria bacterium]|nr:MAG: peptidase U32 [Deltaproteobacteria bacterium]